VTAATEEPDPYLALRSVFADMFERLAGDRVLAEVLPAGTVPGATDAMQRINELIGELLEAAKKDGRVRADATITDVRVLLGGCSAQLARFGDRDPALWRRYGELVLNALRP
jgi:hypothetical protein